MWRQFVLLLVGLAMVTANPISRQVGLSGDVGVITYNNTEESVDAAVSSQSGSPTATDGEVIQVDEQQTELTPQDISSIAQGVSQVDIIPEPAVTNEEEKEEGQAEVVPDIVTGPSVIQVKNEATPEEETTCEPSVAEEQTEQSQAGQQVEIIPAQQASEVPVEPSLAEVPQTNEQAEISNTEQTPIIVEPSIAVEHPDAQAEQVTELIPERSVAEENLASSQDEQQPTVIPEPSVAVEQEQTTESSLDLFEVNTRTPSEIQTEASEAEPITELNPVPQTEQPDLIHEASEAVISEETEQQTDLLTEAPVQVEEQSDLYREDLITESPLIPEAAVAEETTEIIQAEEPVHEASESQTISHEHPNEVAHIEFEGTAAPTEATEAETEAPTEETAVAETQPIEYIQQENSHIIETTEHEASVAETESPVGVTVTQDEEIVVNVAQTEAQPEALEAEVQTNPPVLEEVEIQTEANIAADEVQVEELGESVVAQTETNVARSEVPSETEYNEGGTEAPVEAVEAITDAPVDNVQVEAVEAITDAPVDDVQVEAVEAITDAPVDDVQVEAVEAITDAPVDDVQVEAVEAITDAPVDYVQVEAVEAITDAPVDNVQVDAAVAQTDAPVEAELHTDTEHVAEAAEAETPNEVVNEQAVAEVQTKTANNPEEAVTESLLFFQEPASDNEPVGSVRVSVNGNDFVEIIDSLDAQVEVVTNEETIVTEAADAETPSKSEGDEKVDGVYWTNMNRDATTQQQETENEQEESDDAVEKELQKVAVKYGLTPQAEAQAQQATNSQTPEGDQQFQSNSLRRRRSFVDRVTQYVASFF